MAKQNGYRNSKAIPNLKSATISTLRATVNIATKGIKKTAKWTATDNTGFSQRPRITDLERSANHHLASMALSNRRLDRLSDNVHRLVNTNVGHSTFEVAVGWLVDHAFYICGQLWSFIWSIVSDLLMALFSVLMVIMFNAIFFYAIFWLLFL